MMPKYPVWKYILLAVVIGLGILYALSNLFLEDPAVQISPNTASVTINDALIDHLKTSLDKQQLAYKRIELQKQELLIRFDTINRQLQARDVIQEALQTWPAVRQLARPQDAFTVALTLASSTPKWLAALGAHPMKLGLDLRGGVHFLLEVDMVGVIDRRLQGYMKTLVKALRDARLRYTHFAMTKQNTLLIQFDDKEQVAQAYRLIQNDFHELLVTKAPRDEKALVVGLTPVALNEIHQYTLEQTMMTLRNRVNELGVAEAVVQQQGLTRIAVDLPGIQDAAHAKQILGGTATLGFYLVDVEHDAEAVARGGLAPVGTRLYDYLGQPVLLKNQVVLSGDSIVSARTGLDESGMPAVHISLGGQGETHFTQVTRDNIGKPLAIVYIETKTDTQTIDGKTVKLRRKIERVVSAPRIRGVLGSNFVISGLDAKEARDLSLLLRAGSLPAAIDIVEERTVGPSLGVENIQRGLHSLAVGMGLVVIFMVFYYQAFGVIADLALFVNLILLAALLSILGATLTLPGIAAMVLTVGMAVDSNVLIFERIREELRNGATPHASIVAGYERAFSTIVDANITTLIVAIVLFSVGSGAIRGFAVTLTLGLMTSMFTAITFTRALVHMIYGQRSVKRLAIGI